MQVSFEKVSIGNCHKLVCSYAEGVSVIYVERNTTMDRVVIYDKDGIEMISGSSDFMHKLGCYLTGNLIEDIKTEPSNEIQKIQICH